ncbi:MAG: antitoxin [Anaerolineaceae bacterium]|nr:antitoxin [Anaerolineaceae bacterium]
MSSLYQNLIDRIRNELSDLVQVIERTQEGWSNVQKTPAKERQAFVDSVALNLHGFYSGLERLFELIARQVDGSLPEGANWHRDLLQQMAQDFPASRPAVISQENAEILDEFRRFRHLVRNVYTINLSPTKMNGLLQILPVFWPQLRAELLAFANYLEALSGE